MAPYVIVAIKATAHWDELRPHKANLVTAFYAGMLI